MVPPDLSSILGLSEPVLLVKSEGTLVAVSPGASRLFQRASPELVGKSLTSLVSDDPERITRYLLRCSQNSETISCSLNILPSGGPAITCKAMAGFVHFEEQSHLVWLRLVPRELANTRSQLGGETEENRQSEQRWRTAFENSAIGISMADFEGRIFAANSVFRNMLGYTESELYRLTFMDITHDEDRAANQELVRALVEGKQQHFQMEKRYRRKDGSLLWVRTNVALVPGMRSVNPFWFNVVEDITGRKLAEDKLRASERSLRELTETIPQMLWSADADGGNDYCNQRVLDYTGLSAEEVRSAGWTKAVHRDDIDKMTGAWMTVVSTGQPFQYEFRCLRAADHAYRWCICSALPLHDDNGCIIKWFGSVVDLHDWKEAQQSLQMAQAELARVSRLTTMGELAASIAHEINQPLTAVTNNSSGCLRLLADGNLDPVILRRALEEIVADSTRASAVIARIRAFIRKAPAEKSELDINELIREVFTVVGHELYENQVLLEHQLTKGLPLVLGDRVQLQQVLLNLLMNGIEAMTTVTNRLRLLRVQSRIDESGNIQVAVSDSGTGLGLNADRLFTPFFTTKANGIGMGLSISRSLIEVHGGRLWATSNYPHGAVFCFTLPVAAGSSP